jgi:RecJ-like exonuclease
VDPDLIKAAAMAIVIAGADSADDVRRYSRAFDEASMSADNGRTLPCPRCFLAGLHSGLRSVECGDRAVVTRCTVCGETIDCRAADR